MKNKKMVEINKDGWNKLIKSEKKFSNTILPEYGPFLKRNEEDLRLFENITGKKILDLGCGAGASLEYLYQKGAREVWGIDISEEQIKKAKVRFPEFKENFWISPMEEELKVPINYFDYIISIFSIGYTSDLEKTFNNAYKHLNENGALIISWTHPFYYCLDIENDKVILNKSYFSENTEMITKGPDKINLVQYNLMISTIVNKARKTNLYLDNIIEEETVLKDDVNGYKSTFWKKEKTENCPSTIIFKFKKLRE